MDKVANSPSTARVNADDARIDALKEQLRSHPIAEVDYERHVVMRDVYDVTVAVSRANEPTVALLARYDLLDLIGENRAYPTNRHAIAAYRQEHGQPGPEAGPTGQG